jgi:hypothetical protein
LGLTIMEKVKQGAERETPGSLGHDISIPIGSRSPVRAPRAGISVLVLVWSQAVTSGCSGTASSGAPGTGGNLGTGGGGGGDGPTLTDCPDVQPDKGTACAGQFSCSYGQQKCCGHVEPARVAYCQLGRLVVSSVESGCTLGLVCPVDGGDSDAADGTALDAQGLGG